MAQQQKRALISLGIGIVWFPAWIALVMSEGAGFTGYFQDESWRGDWAFGAVFLVGLISVIAIQVVLRAKHGRVDATADERDVMIFRRARVVAAFVTFISIVLAWLVPWSIYAGRGDETISIDLLPFIGLVQAIVFFVTEAIATLVLYGRKGSYAEG